MSASTSTPAAPKSMSSRLLTMKFMQRAAASSPNTTSSPSTPDEPSPKRRKKDSDSPSNPRFDVNALADQRAIQAAVVEEEAKRQAALERAAAEAGDTRWVLSFEDQLASSSSPNLALRVVQTGYANLDAPPNSRATEVDIEENPVMVGRRSFGKFNKVLEKQNGDDQSDSSSEEDDEEESEEESGDDGNPASELIRSSRQEAADRAKAQRKAKKRAEKAESEKLAKKRKKNEVKLNGLTSLSGRANTFSGTCFVCGGPHHKKDCPQQNKRGYRGGDEGPPRKAIKTR